MVLYGKSLLTYIVEFRTYYRTLYAEKIEKNKKIQHSDRLYLHM